jgi:two-component system CheB/CheR fusion protein
VWLLDRAEPGGEQASRAKQIIQRQVDHLSRIVDDLLDVTRITRGKIDLQKGRVDLADLVHRTVEDYKALFTARGVELVQHLGSLSLWLDADATRVSQAVGNLLQNAAKFTERGGRVEVGVTREPHGTALVRVRDDGLGIAPELLGRIFDPFTQGDDSLHRSRGGLGVGLSLVKGFVELHGGSVEARSEGRGRGAEFLIRLPVAPERPAFRGPSRTAVTMPRRRVLVVEDNVDAAETLRDVLLTWDHEVEVAHDGREGVEKAQAFRPDVVLCDIGLPVMDGYEVARALRADPALSSCVLVAVTGTPCRRTSSAPRKPASTGTSASPCRWTTSRRSSRRRRSGGEGSEAARAVPRSLKEGPGRPGALERTAGRPGKPAGEGG